MTLAKYAKNCSQGTAYLFLLVGLSACSTVFDGDPSLSRMALNGSTMPEAYVSVPMPEPEPARLRTRADGASLWQNGESGFFGDQRATRVGDILTVSIEIDDEAQLRNASNRSRSSEIAVGTPTFFGYDLPENPLVDLGAESEAQGAGSIRRSEKIDLKVAALIIDELPNGNLVVAGRQEVKVNSELRELRVSGIIRPVDITKDNSITYEKIAEARISYGGRGQLSQVQRPSYGQRALDVILPY